jgi:hypothetical protein
MTQATYALGRWLRFVVAETLGGGIFAVGYLLWGTRGFRRWRDQLDETQKAVLPNSPTDPRARPLYIGVGAVGAIEGCAYALARPLLPKRAALAGPIFSSVFAVAVLCRGKKNKERSGKAVAALGTKPTYLRSAAVFGSVLAVVERLSR